MAGLSVFFLYNLTARAQDIGILSISNPSKEVIALKHFSLPHGLVPLLALALVVSMATPASAFFWQKKENTPAGVADFSKNTPQAGPSPFPRRISGPLTCPPSPSPPSRIPRPACSP